MFESSQACCMTHSPAIQRMCSNLCNALLLGLATIKAHQYACDVPRWNFSWVVYSGTPPLYGFWLWIVSADVTALTFAHSMQFHCNTGNQDFHRMSSYWFDVTSSQAKTGYLHNILLGRKQGSTGSVALLHALELLWCVCFQTPLTMSANQLHVNEQYFLTSSQKFTSQLLGKCMQFLVYA